MSMTEVTSLFNSMTAVEESGSGSERDMMIYRNAPLVGHVVKSFTHSSVEYEDMLSSGFVGLIKAADTFDPTMGYKFSTYAAVCIRNEILMEIRRETRRGKTLSLESSVATDYDGNELKLSDLIASDDDTETAVQTSLLLRNVNTFIKSELTPVETRVIYLRYMKNKKQVEIAKELGQSQAGISRTEARALRKIRERIEDAV